MRKIFDNGTAAANATTSLIAAVAGRSIAVTDIHVMQESGTNTATEVMTFSFTDSVGGTLPLTFDADFAGVAAPKVTLPSPWIGNQAIAFQVARPATNTGVVRIAVGYHLR